MRVPAWFGGKKIKNKNNNQTHKNQLLISQDSESIDKFGAL